MVSYVVPKLVMEVSRLHVAQNVEDDAATATMRHSVDHFEHMFSDAFDNISLWRDKLVASSEGKLTLVTASIEQLGLLFTGLTGPFQRWSTAAVHQNVSMVIESLQNSEEILKIGKYFMVHVFFHVCGKDIIDMGVHLSDMLQNAEQIRQGEGDDDLPEKLNEQNVRLSTLILEMTTKIHDYQKGLSACAGLIKDMHNRWFTIAMDVLRRAGSLAKDALGEVNRVPFESDLDHSLDQLENCAEYITKVAEVAMAIASKETPANFESNVIDLAKLTSRWPTEPIKWFAESSATDPVVLSQLSEKMQIFTDTIGDAGCQSSACNADGSDIYNRATCDLVGQSIENIKAVLDFGVGDVHKEVVENARRSAVFQMLIREVKDTADLELGINFEDGDAKDLQKIACCPHHNAMRNLRQFVVASSLAHIKTDWCVNLNCESDKQMPVDDAVVYFDIANKTNDIASVMASLQRSLYSNVGGSDAVSLDTEGCNKAVYMQAILSNMIVQLDGVINSHGALKLEANGWQLPFGVQTLRSWLVLVGIFARKCRNYIIQMMCEHVNTLADVVKTTIPSYGAAFKNAVMDVKMACSFFDNKLGPVIKAYNDLHGGLARLSVSAELMLLTPAVSENELTSQTVAVGVEMLGKATQASVLIRGSFLIAENSNKPQGSALAREFLEKNRNQRTSGIPECFWRELEAMKDASTEEVGRAMNQDDSKTGSASGGGTPKPKQKDTLSQVGSCSKLPAMKAEGAETSAAAPSEPAPPPTGTARAKSAGGGGLRRTKRKD
ncbi:unnamed protein product [Prorocentrum cordatum]|uniref:Exocyst complex component n=1 Tax=Prorocentrum cordatum TaxID=2364126 RepID=A0ABN9XCG6_9DINO|nr:unnamed protein product [Polarella glacialis]